MDIWTSKIICYYNIKIICYYSIYCIYLDIFFIYWIWKIHFYIDIHRFVLVSTIYLLFIIVYLRNKIRRYFDIKFGNCDKVCSLTSFVLLKYEN